MTKPMYTAEATVTGGRADGHGVSSDGKLDVRLRQPKELGGDGDGTNPEQLFAVGYAACFSAVLSMLGRREGVEAGDAVVESKVHLIPQGDGTFRLGVELGVTLPSIGDVDQAVGLVQGAHRVCPYSNATRGNVDVALRVNGVSV
ncbi:organic hydroperoxide resistance protein [Actinomadura sp. ATCC 31491]|uniref:Organic hydroperoxide resistance protein n=1 Tax=Actinomadura luzonensis TaxID=2805427 RepID=A0ABT0FRQ2_9ACTN|nr:organic hydroperoxide resistance protein [Actinomadura luzonensis]MCK2214990.1 organic hydroperoxide resistance protein [Actinomadura luzonensis]